jgi:uncharacterized protein (TIGR03435 family)
MKQFVLFQSPDGRMPVVLVAACFALTISAFAQQAAPAPQDAATRALAYEAVTIKPDPSSSGFMRFSPDSFAMGGMPLVQVIRSAYELLGEDQIVGLPVWAKSEPFTIQAKMDANTAAALDKLPPMQRWKETRLMLQALLVGRFGLKVHHEARDLPIYVLTVAKGGLKMKLAAPGAAGNANYASGRIDAHAVSPQMLAMNLSYTVGRPIVNKTGLEGGYDVALDYAPEGADASDTRPSLFSALEEQLGLKLVSSKGPVDVIVIDHIERPSEN